MIEKIKIFILAGIFLCLITICFRTNISQQSYTSPSQIDLNTGETIIQLAPNRIAIIDNHVISGMRGTIIVFEYNENKKTFDFIGNFNYQDYFANPNKYGL